MAETTTAQAVITDEAADAAVDVIAELAKSYGAGGRYFVDALTELMTERVFPSLGIEVDYPADAQSLAS